MSTPGAASAPRGGPEPEHPEQVRAIAADLAARGLAGPALFLLEVARPFRLLCQQTLLVTQPLLRPWYGDRPLLWASLFEERETVEQLVSLLAAARGPQTHAGR